MKRILIIGAVLAAGATTAVVVKNSCCNECPIGICKPGECPITGDCCKK
jgi:hypothetical protein